MVRSGSASEIPLPFWNVRFSDPKSTFHSLMPRAGHATSVGRYGRGKFHRCPMMKLATAITLSASELAGRTGSRLLSCHDYRHEVRLASTVQGWEECGGVRFLRASSRSDQ